MQYSIITYSYYAIHDNPKSPFLFQISKVDDKAEDVWGDKTEYGIKASIACSQTLDFFQIMEKYLYFHLGVSIMFVYTK